jgi:hypothetical protein
LIKDKGLNTNGHRRRNGGRAIAASSKKINKSGGLRKKEKAWIKIEILSLFINVWQI